MRGDMSINLMLEGELASLLPIGDVFPKVLISRIGHETCTREGVLVLDLARCCSVSRRSEHCVGI